MLHESISLPVAATLLLVVGLWWLLAGVVTHQSPYAEFHRLIYQILAQLEFYLRSRISPIDRFVEGYFIPRVHLRPFAEACFRVVCLGTNAVIEFQKLPLCNWVWAKTSIYFLEDFYLMLMDLPKILALRISTNIKPRKATEETHKVKNIFINTNLIITKDSRHQFKPHSKIQTPSSHQVARAAKPSKVETYDAYTR